MKRAACISLIFAASVAAAENPLQPGDLVVPFRTMEGGSFVEDASGNITGRTGFTIRNAPQTGYENTCWRVLSVSATSVSVELVKGIFRPHWSPDTAYEEFEDEFSIAGSATFPTSIERKEFSIFRAVTACP